MLMMSTQNQNWINRMFVEKCHTNRSLYKVINLFLLLIVAQQYNRRLMRFALIIDTLIADRLS